MNTYEQLDAWTDAHFDEQVRRLRELIRVPADTPRGNNAPHAERTAELRHGYGLDAEKYPVSSATVGAKPFCSMRMAMSCHPVTAGPKTPTAARLKTARSTAAAQP